MKSQEARWRLREVMVSLCERRSRLEHHVHHREEALAADFAEQAVELENVETMVALDEQLQLQAHEVRAALERIDRGTYGDCEACGSPIDQRRLEALPATRLCIGCANRKDLMEWQPTPRSVKAKGRG